MAERVAPLLLHSDPQFFRVLDGSRSASPVIGWACERRSMDVHCGRCASAHASRNELQFR
jgi:hypothetical protein